MSTTIQIVQKKRFLDNPAAWCDRTKRVIPRGDIAVALVTSSPISVIGSYGASFEWSRPFWRA